MWSPNRGGALAPELRALVGAELGKPLTPAAVHFVSDLPKTRNAKLMRRVIRSAYLGQDPGDTSSLVNPEIVEELNAKAQRREDAKEEN